MTLENKTSRVSRWRYNLVEYNYEIVYKKGSLNVKADANSVSTNQRSDTTIDNVFNKNLSSEITLWRENIVKEQDSDDWIRGVKLTSKRGYFVEDTKKGNLMIIL